jgi:small subunit ribosomal protein S6
MRRYESVVILEPEMADDDIRNFTEKYTTLIKTNGGEIIKVEDWGFKRLAYRVKKRDRGRYLIFDFVGMPAVISELERQFKISEEVMKFLSVKVDDEVDLEAFQAAAQGRDVVSEDQQTLPDESIIIEPAAQAPDNVDPTTGPSVTSSAVSDHPGSDLSDETDSNTRHDQDSAQTPDDASVQVTHKEGL